jgi:hypothetical protein
VPSPMPTREAVRKLLADLFARRVSMERAAAASHEHAYVADLITDEDALFAICAMDLPLSAYMGSALCQISVGVARDSLRQGKLPENLQENLREVINILSSAFNGEGMTHLRLRDMYAAGTQQFEEVTGHLSQAAARYNLNVSIDGYGDGKLTLAVVR